MQLKYGKIVIKYILDQSQVKENKMGTMPVNRLLIPISFHILVSTLVQALYNVVDSIFVSYISENTLTSVSY